MADSNNIDNKIVSVSQAAIASDIGVDKPAAEKTPEKDAAPDKTGDKKEKEFVSAGWKVHNEITYRVIDWLVNSSIGVAFAYWSSRTESGKKIFQEPVSGAFKKILKPVLKSEAALNEGAKWGTMFAGIMAGGTAIIPPMMAMENKNNKKKIVRWLDEKIYGKEAVETDPKFEESYKRIDEEPKMGFGIGMASRLLAIAPLITVASIPATNKPLIKHLYDRIGSGTKWAAKKIGIKPSQNMLDPMKGALEHLDGDPNVAPQMQSNWDFLHRTIGFDFGLTIVYALLHEAAFKALAGMGMKETDPKETVATSEPEKLLKEVASYDPLLPLEDKNITPTYQEPAVASEPVKKFTSDISPRKSLAATVPMELHTQQLAAEADNKLSSPSL